jgi:hypothetical protein
MIELGKKRIMNNALLSQISKRTPVDETLFVGRTQRAVVTTSLRGNGLDYDLVNSPRLQILSNPQRSQPTKSKT